MPSLSDIKPNDKVVALALLAAAAMSIYYIETRQREMVAEMRKLNHHLNLLVNIRLKETRPEAPEEDVDTEEDEGESDED